MSEFKNIRALDGYLMNTSDELHANTGLTGPENYRRISGLILTEFDNCSCPQEKSEFDFVLANSASGSRGSELEIRRQIIEDGGVDVMVAAGSNLFSTVTFPCSLWFFVKGKTEDRKNKVLFIDARHIFRPLTRTVRDFNGEQLNFIANIVHLYRCEAADNTVLNNQGDDKNGDYRIDLYFTNGQYQDVVGLCKVATIAEIEERGWSLNPGRYVGVAQEEDEHEEISARLKALQEGLVVLNSEAHELEQIVAENVVGHINGPQT